MNSITLPRKALMISVPIAVLLAAILGTTLYTHRKQAKRLNALNESNTVVLADLVNTTGEEVFNAPLKMALSNDLEQSPFWMLLSDAKINQQMRFMGRTPGEHLTVDLAKEICQRQGAKLVLAGSISRHSGHYPITLQGLNCRTGGVLDSEQLEADSREEVLDTLGETAKRLRIKLGESLQSVAKYDVPLTNATTSSFQALQAYTTAMKTAHSLGEEAALGLFKRAIELDPNFTLAYSQLALSYYDLSQFAVSAEYAKKAYEMRARVTERERLAIESFYEQFNRGDFEKTAELYKETQKTYPQDVSAVANLATIQSFLGQYDEAAGNGEEAVRRDPENANNYSNLAGYYLNANRIDKAAAILEDAKKHQFETGLLLDQQYLIAFLKEDGGKISEIVSGVAGNESTESDILALHAATHAYYGRLKKARDLSDQVIASAQRQNAKELEAILSATAALYEAEYGNLVRARHRATSALQLSVGRIDKPAVAFALARTGYTRQATMVAQDLHRQFPQDTFLNFFWLPVINAANALSQSNPAKALDFLEGARFETGNPPPSFGLLYPPYLRGEAYLNLRNGPAAALQFQKIVNHPGLIVNSPLAALVNLQIGRANVLSGDLKNAKVYYDRFFALWREADVDIPILKEASAEYLRLRTQESSREGRNQFQFVSLKSVN